MATDYRLLLLSAFRADAVHLRRFVRWGTAGDRKMADDALATYRRCQSEARAGGLDWPITLSVANLSQYIGVEMQETLVDTKCMKALKKAGLDKAAECLAQQAVECDAPQGSFTLNFLKDDEEADGAYIATLTVSVKRV